MTQLIINSVTGFIPPFSGYVCDFYGNQCVYIGIISSLPTTITLPSQYDNAPVITLKLVDNNCEKSTILYCADLPPTDKQFQDGEFFFFMDGDNYEFQ